MDRKNEIRAYDLRKVSKEKQGMVEKMKEKYKASSIIIQ